MGWRLPLGLSLSPGELRAVRVVRRKRRLRVTARRTVLLPRGALAPAPEGLAVADEEALLGAFREVLAGSSRGGEVAIALPDSACLVQVLRFPELQPRGEELKAFLLWQVADLLPFPPKEARLACQILRREGRAADVALLLAHEGLLARVEELLGRAGGSLVHAGSTLTCLHNAWEHATAGRGTEGLLHLGGGALGLLLRQDGVPTYARSIALPEQDGQPAAIRPEIEASLEFASGREGLAPPTRLLLAGEGNLGAVAAMLAEALQIPAEVLGDRVPAWGALWDGLPPTAAEAAATGAALSPSEGP